MNPSAELSYSSSKIPLRGRMIAQERGFKRAHKSLSRFVEKHLMTWLAAHGVEPSPNEVAEYDVKIHRRGEGHEYDCTMELRVGRRRFVASEFAPDLHKALKRCLDHLIPVSPQPLQLALVTA